MIKKCKVLFLCSANSARSIMAEALLRELSPDHFEAYSAGVEPATQVHPLTIAQLKSTVSDLDRLQPKHWDQYTRPDAPEMDVVVAMSADAAALAPSRFPGSPVLCQWNFVDPVEKKATESEQVRAFDQVFRQILRRISVFVALPLHSMKASEQRHAVNEI
jgi:protein-tyrosine-phosphatase